MHRDTGIHTHTILTQDGLQGKAGVDNGPLELIKSGLLQSLRHDLNYELHGDQGVLSEEDLATANAEKLVHMNADLLAKEDPPVRNMKNPRSVSGVTQRLAEQVHAHAAAGRMVLTLGGDHSIAIGTVSGSARAVRERLGREVAVIWVDAHADINTPESSDSGNVHGMPVSFVTGLATESDPEVFGWLKPEHRLNVKKLVYIGLRDVDKGEKKILRDNGIKAFSMFDIDR